MTREALDAWFRAIEDKATIEGWDSPGVQAQLAALSRQEQADHDTAEQPLGREAAWWPG